MTSQVPRRAAKNFGPRQCVLSLPNPEEMRGRLLPRRLEVTMLYDRDDKMPRLTFLHEYNIDDSMEKRARSLGLPWPPWVVLGRRVFYSRQRTQEWFAEQEAKSLLGGDTP